MSERTVTRVSRSLQAFAKAHGGSADVAVEHLGRGRARVVAVGADGTWGDQVVASVEDARAACEQSGVAVHDTLPREVETRLRTGAYEWRRMAGLQLGGRPG